MVSDSCVTTSLSSPPSSSSRPLPNPSAPQGRDTNGLVDGELPVEAGPQLLQFLILALLELDPVLQLLQPVFQLLHLFLGSKTTKLDELGRKAVSVPALSSPWGALPAGGVGLDKRSQAGGWPTTVLKNLCKKALVYYKGGSSGWGVMRWVLTLLLAGWFCPLDDFVCVLRSCQNCINL